MMPNYRQQRMLNALSAKQFFKLIGGGSLTEAGILAKLCSVYAQAGADCLDLTPDPLVLSEVEAALKTHFADDERPVVMISLPLDPDPHFRKIDLVEADCILCGACLPVCPTEALSLQPEKLDIEQPLCYGCGRCPEVCPTDALILHPFLPEEQTETALSHPLTEAVEIHTRYADPDMLGKFLVRYHSLLQDKLLAFCFRPSEVPLDHWQDCVQQLIAFSSFPIILQIDGNPMSGSDDPEASLPSLKAAYDTFEGCGNNLPVFWTISGGINLETANQLHTLRYHFIHGVGMGTYGRQKVWSDLTQEENIEKALETSTSIIEVFKSRENSAIIKPESKRSAASDVDVQPSVT